MEPQPTQGETTVRLHPPTLSPMLGYRAQGRFAKLGYTPKISSLSFLPHAQPWILKIKINIGQSSLRSQDPDGK